MREAFKIAFLTALLLASGTFAKDKSTNTNEEDSASFKEKKEVSPCMKACEAQGDDPLDCETTCVMTAEGATRKLQLACR